MTPEKFAEIGDAACVSIAAAPDYHWKGAALETRLWEDLRVEMQRRYRRSTGETMAVLYVSTDEDEITTLRKELAEARAALESADARISLLVEDFKTTDRVTKVYAIRATFVALSDIRSAFRPPSKAKGEKK